MPWDNNTIMGQKRPGPALARRAVISEGLRVPARGHGQPDVLLLVGPVGRHVLGLVVDLRGKPDEQTRVMGSRRVDGVGALEQISTP